MAKAAFAVATLHWYNASREISDVKQCWNWLVVGWETTYEHQMLLPTLRAGLFCRELASWNTVYVPEVTLAIQLT